MKNNFNLIFAPFALIVFACFFNGGCGDMNDTLVPLYNVEIPDYDGEDYLKLLDNKNPEIVYSSISFFVMFASDFGSTLSSDTIKDTAQTLLAKKVYSKISILAQSENEWITCASLRFLGSFGSRYKNKKELTDILLKVNPGTKSSKLEYINCLYFLLADLKPFEDRINKYVSSDSWVISRNSYKLLSVLANDTNFRKLKERYANAEEYDKLLIISSLGKHYGDESLDFILSLLKSETNKKVKLLLAKSLVSAGNNDKVLQWIKMNHAGLREIHNDFMEFCIDQMDSVPAARMVNLQLEENLVSDSLVYGSSSRLFGKLYSDLMYEDADSVIKGNRKEYENIEKQLFKNEKFKEYWTNYKLRQKKPVYSPEYLARQCSLIKQFKENETKLLNDFKIDDTKRENILNDIENMKSSHGSCIEDKSKDHVK